jgi:hypothetical protein
MGLAGERSRKILMYHMMQQQARAKAPEPPPEDAPTITPEEERAILEAAMPIPEPEPSFVRRNAIPLFVGGGALILGVIGVILLIKI